MQSDDGILFPPVREADACYEQQAQNRLLTGQRP